MKAIWKGTVLAESDHTSVLEGNHYFPPESLNRTYFEESRTTSLCIWKGKANYLTVVVDGERNRSLDWRQLCFQARIGKTLQSLQIQAVALDR